MFHNFPGEKSRGVYHERSNLLTLSLPLMVTSTFSVGQRDSFKQKCIQFWSPNCRQWLLVLFQDQLCFRFILSTELPHGYLDCHIPLQAPTLTPVVVTAPISTSQRGHIKGRARSEWRPCPACEPPSSCVMSGWLENSWANPHPSSPLGFGGKEHLLCWNHS